MIVIKKVRETGEKGFEPLTFGVASGCYLAFFYDEFEERETASPTQLTVCRKPNLKT